MPSLLDDLGSGNKLSLEAFALLKKLHEITLPNNVISLARAITLTGLQTSELNELYLYGHITIDGDKFTTLVNELRHLVHIETRGLKILNKITEAHKALHAMGPRSTIGIVKAELTKFCPNIEEINVSLTPKGMARAQGRPWRNVLDRLLNLAT